MQQRLLANIAFPHFIAPRVWKSRSSVYIEAQNWVCLKVAVEKWPRWRMPRRNRLPSIPDQNSQFLPTYLSRGQQVQDRDYRINNKPHFSPQITRSRTAASFFPFISEFISVVVNRCPGPVPSRFGSDRVLNWSHANDSGWGEREKARSGANSCKNRRHYRCRRLKALQTATKWVYLTSYLPHTAAITLTLPGGGKEAATRTVRAQEGHTHADVMLLKMAGRSCNF